MPKRKPLSELGPRQLRRVREKYAGVTTNSQDHDSSAENPSVEVDDAPGLHPSVEVQVDDEELKAFVEIDNDSNYSLGFVDPSSDCEGCRSCLCLSCVECFHAADICNHCDKCVRGFVGCEHDSDADPVPSDTDSSDTDLDSDEHTCESVNTSSHNTDDFTEALITWALTFSISIVALSRLLKILKLVRPDLPADGRTLLKTPRFTPMRDVAPGQYWHCGLINGMKKLLQGTKLSSIAFSIGIDGIPISGSSGSCLWPILCSVRHCGIFIVGAYHGYEKPSDANNFLREFIQEAVELVSNGLEIGMRRVKCVFETLICDAPAKSFVLKIKSHVGKSSCTKCSVEGKYLDHRMSFPELTARRRSDESFVAQVDSEHHTGISDLLLIPAFGPVSNVILDYVHLICLGVTRKLLYFWMTGKLGIRLPSATISIIGTALGKFASFVPCEFARKPRSLKYVKQWKATEFRQFLLYTGPIALYGQLPQPLFQNFLSLHVAISVLCSEQLCNSTHFQDYAGSLLEHFVLSFKTLYGEQYISHNVHNVIHLLDDMKKYGNLDKWSAFPFENFLQQVKSLIRKGDKPLAQLARRYGEKCYLRQDVPGRASDELQFLWSHNDGVLTVGCSNPQYKAVKFSNFTLSIKNHANNCCETVDGHIVCIENICFSRKQNCMVIIGRAYKDKDDLYETPCPSSSLGIFKVRNLSHISVWPINTITRKMVKLPIGRHWFAIFPLLHLETEASNRN